MPGPLSLRNDDAMNSRRSLIESSAKRLCDSINDEVSRCKKVCMENEEVCTSLKKAAEEEAAATKAEAAKRAAEVDAERSELRAEKVAMEGLHAVATAGPIELDVGGTRFSTSRSTLVRVEGSMLEAMFSGRHALAPSSDGSYFIDRDPSHFRHILNFLRTGAAITPACPAARAEMVAEAQFYGLAQLVRALNAPPLDMDTALGRELSAQRAAEDSLRARLRDESKCAALGKHAGLVSLFERGSALSLRSAPAAGLEYTTDGPTFPQLLAGFAAKHHHHQQAPPPGNLPTRVAVASRDEFLFNFNRDYPNILSRLQPLLAGPDHPASRTRLFIAGGSVLHALTSNERRERLGQLPLPRGAERQPAGRVLRRGHQWGPAGDVDIFVNGGHLLPYSLGEFTLDGVRFSQVHSCGGEEAAALSEQIFNLVAVDAEMWTVTRGCGVITMQHHNHNRAHLGTWQGENRSCFIDQTVQIILRMYESPSEVLLGFDIDCCAVGYDGEAVWALPRAIRAIRHGYNILNPLHAWPNRAAYEVRLAKFAARGFSIAVPGYDPKLIDLARITSTPTNKLRGLARLLRIAFALDFAPESCAGNALHNGVQPVVLNYNQTFQNLMYDALGEDELHALMQGMATYDDNEIFDGPALVVPACFKEAGIDEAGRIALAHAWSWCQHFSIGSLRAEAWAEIKDAGEQRSAARVPRRLAEAWDKEKRSREYLNADEPDCNAKYYAEAYADPA